MLGRSLFAAALCLTLAGTLWVMPLVAGQEGGETLRTAQEGWVNQLDAPLPAVAQLRLDTTSGRSLVAQAQSPAGLPAVAPQPDPLVLWAAQTASLIGLPEAVLIGYGTADLVMQDQAPNCRLSWITLAALGRVGTKQLPPDGGTPAAVSTAEKLCARGRDTTTDTGWESAVRSVDNDTAFVHRVLAAATTFASALKSGVPIEPAARAAIDFAIDQIGLPYVWGGNGPGLGDAGFDCSGLTKAAYATAGINLPRTAHTQYFATRHIPNGDSLQPGDLLFYGNPATKIHHVGLYIGNGQMINAPTFGMPVQVASYRAAGRDFAGAGRPVG